MRRVCRALPAAAVVPTRGVYSIWGTVVHENNDLQPKNKLPMTQRLSSDVGLKGHQLQTTPVSHYPGLKLSPAEEYLFSAMDDDTKRIMAVDWTVEFDSFWVDRVQSHEMMFDYLYSTQKGWMAKWMFGNCSRNTDAKAAATTKLNYLKSALKWAQESEKAYSAIANARFEMQRDVFDPLQREKILAGCVEVSDKLADRVPTEFKRKATMDVEWHVNNMRHWVWDAPNAKQHFKRRLA